MKALQKKIKDFCGKNDMESTVEYRLLDTLSELGEVSKEVLKMSNYGRKPLEYNNSIRSELGDVLFSLITVANSFDIDLEEEVNGALEKYEHRLKKGSAGSENE